MSVSDNDNRTLSAPALLGDIVDVVEPLSEAFAALSRRVADLGSQLDRIALMGAKIHELENRAELKYCDVWRDSQQYREGNLVTHAGALWICREATSDRPGRSKAFKMIVKSGGAT